jgi:4-aminobutyrate aminotransferase
VELAEKLAALAPGDSERLVYFGNSGAEALEAAIKLARWKTRRPAFISFFNAFHGRTMGALSLTASKSIQKAGFGPLLSGFYHATYADPYRMGPDAAETALASVDHLFSHVVAPADVAGIVVEPIQGEGGYIVPPDSFLQGLRQRCDDHGILLIFDEVQSGVGRTGKLWASEHSGVKADIVTSAKGLASGMPLGATFASASVMDWPPGAHASTFGGNPIACAAALKTFELLDRELLSNSATIGEVLRGELEARVADHPNVGDIRGRGLMLGVELVTDRITKERAIDLRNRVVRACFDQGLLILGCGKNTVRFSPALILSSAEATVAAEIFADVLTRNT